jgi:putative ABC transport system permease protein
MIAYLHLALAYLRYQTGRSALLVVIFSILMAIPVLASLSSQIAEDHLLSRAKATPLVYAAPGSRLDAALSALFFKGEPVASLAMQDYDQLFEMELGLPLPILRAGTAGGYSVVATDLEYFPFRRLAIASGRSFVQLGDAVIGHRVADALGLEPGGQITTDTTRIFELAGTYPVRLNVVGVLQETGMTDDFAIFVDLRTGWVATGLGHGHQDLETVNDQSVILSRDGNTVIANAKLTEFIEFTEETRDGFHFHGDQGSLPLSTIMIAPYSERAAAFIQGRVADQYGENRQIFRPIAVIEELLQDVFRIGTILQVMIAIITVATVLAVSMVVSLSLRMRKREFEVARQIGADRLAVQMQVLLELALLIFVAAGLCAVIAFAGNQWGNVLFNSIYLGLITS